MSEPTPYQKQVIEQLYDLLLLSNWKITYESVENIDDQVVGGRVVGLCNAHPRYNAAHITYANDALLHTIVHEHFHIVTARTKQAAERIIEMLPKQYQDAAFDLFMDALEPDIEHLTRIVLRILSEFELKDIDNDVNT